MPSTRADEGCAAEQRVADGEVLREATNTEKGPRSSAALVGGSACHDLRSIAERNPSDSRLNDSDVMKIMTPGSAATYGVE